MYKVCGWRGCPGSALLSGFDDAVADGVDLLSVSIGSSAYARPDYSTDPIAIGAFHAVANGITVVCSAGNDGPYSGTVVNAAPWIFTVAATTIDRKFESDVVLGGSNEAVKGESINFSNLEKSAVYPLIYGGSATSNSSDDASASHCEYGALDANKIKGKIVLCYHSDDRDSPKSSKADIMQISGAIGAIFVQDAQNSIASTYITFPATEITSQAAANIFTYINSTKNPVVTILPTITVDKYKPAPDVASFSSRGPSAQTSNILKPDIAAPGVNILASWIPTNGSSEVPPGQEPSTFHLDSGTSMSCPHVTGVAATIKSWNPTWSPSAIRSAIMTTANLLNNNKAPITTDSGSTATPYDYGAGEVNPNDALQPGLVYEVETEDYLQFLCNYGYQATTIKLITKVPDGFECPKNSSKDLISNLNYPSMSVSNFTGTPTKVLSRVVTNVGGNEATTYTVSVKSPPGLDVKVVPDKLQFTMNTKKLTYQVTFSSSSTLKSDAFGSITWTDGTHRVRSPFVVSST
ncbi:CO(2)-response secreted protease-like [Iris pallida]|uniref:CO(2)-response secreted protease-like n=1 Tax=Iris pallida TaxID=29817 RepID=A0AAX6FRE4_IRIPA|nr:CO(2)-response secreted protease-like [Iris pallida]